MYGHNKRGGGKRFNRSKFDGNSKKYKSDVQPEQLTEKDVGITQYISNLKGFSGILKARFSDFQVNEINLNGEIAKFSNTTEPEGFDSDSLNKDIIVPNKTPCDDVPQDIWTRILAVVDSNEDEVVELDCTNIDKEKRSNIHSIVKRILQKNIIASTITRDNKKYIIFKKYKKQDRTDNRTKWPIDKGEYVYFLVYKENIDTLEATLKISDCVRIKASAFNYAGVKDRRGKTTQWFSIRKVVPSKLLRRTKCLRNIHIGNIMFQNVPLKLGKLQGNRFRIALRNVTADNDLINKSMENIKEQGFINYYGLQRFGNDKEVPTYEIGVKLLQGKFKEACDLILKCKKCDNPVAEISQAKKVYVDTGDAANAVKLLKQKECVSVEAKLLYGLAKSNVNDYVNALENIPRNMRLLYIHAFQAFIWNSIISRRVKEFGLKPIVGDLVLCNDEETNNENDEIKAEDAEEERDQNEECVELETNRKQNVKILTQDDVENYTIDDVVFPLPGYDIIYPENIVKDWYKSILEKNELSLEMPKQSVRTYTLSGAYRSIIKKVTNLSWKIMRYNDPNDDLIRSDYDEFLNKPEPTDKPDGQYKALIVDFCLHPSCYATMVIREILKTDTSSAAHTKLNQYHAKKEPPKIIAAKVEEPTIDIPSPGSLLSDPAKYEDFKKAIFGFSSGDDSLKRKSDDLGDDSIPQKKIKEDHENNKSDPKVQATLV